MKKNQTLEVFKKTLKQTLEAIFQNDLTVENEKTFSGDKTINEYTVFFLLENKERVWKIFYTLDQNFLLSFLKLRIKDFELIDQEKVSLEKIFTELNKSVLFSADKEFNKSHYFHKPDIIRGIGKKLNEGNTVFNFIDFENKWGKFAMAFEENEQPAKNSKKDSNSENKMNNQVISARQLLEIKHVVLTTLTEIKDLRGDPDFMLRKAKAVTELAKVWLEVVKEEV